MKRDIDSILKHALSPMEEPDERLNRKILYQAEEIAYMKKKRTGSISAAVLAAAFTLVIGSTAVFAAWRYLSPTQIAEEVGDKKLAGAFQSEDAVLVNETQEYGGYKVTLLGAVAGKNISGYLAEDDKGILKDDMLYTAVAIERADGTPMPSTSDDAYGEETFYVSPYIHGLDPSVYSIMSMGGGYSAFVQDGIQYRLVEMENIEAFADQGIYIGVNSGTFYDGSAYQYDENTGEMTRDESYEGVNALFVLPLDESKADSDAAKAYLERLQAEWEAPDEPREMDEADMEVEEWLKMFEAGLADGKGIEEYAEVVESTVQICKPDEEGLFAYSWELESGSGESGIGDIAYFTDWGKKQGDSMTAGCGYSEGLSDLAITVFTWNEDGTVTVAAYRPK